MLKAISPEKDRPAPVRLAIVGCGAVGLATHVPAALRSNRVKITALVDSTVRRAQDALRRYSLQAVAVSRLADVLDRVDGALIATPNHTHFEIASTALRAGVPVLVEKPITGTYEEAVRLCELGAEEGVLIAVGYRTRHSPSVRLMKQLVETGYFGRIRSFHYEFGSAGGWAPVWEGYSVDRKKASGGVLVGTGTHFLDRMLYWFGEPEILEYRDDNYGGVEANCSARVRYSNTLGNFEGTILLSKTVGLKNRFELETDLHSCILLEAEEEVVTLLPRLQPELEVQLHRRRKAETAPVDSFQAQIEDFADCIRSGKAPLVDGWFAARSVKLLEDLYARRQQLPEPWMWYRQGELNAEAALARIEDGSSK